MSRRRALVVHTRMPAFDRDSGSQDIDNAIRFLLDDGWSVSFLAMEDANLAEQRHADRLRAMGVATYTGFASAERVIRSDDFDLALIAFWELAEKVVPLLRTHSPGTRVVVNSMDVHFLRHARRSFGRSQELAVEFGDDTVRELNAYNAADAVIAVSEKERSLLADFVGDDRVFTLPLAESVPPSTIPVGERRGMLFVANFRHEPNREAAEYLCREVLPMLDRDLLERHPLTIVGNWLTEARLDIDPNDHGLELVGWVPSVEPYRERSRISVVPLLNGAGVKRKVLQSMMARTPVVTTLVGAEGLGLVQGEHALIAADAADLAAGVTRLLRDDALWCRLAENGAAHVTAQHGEDVVRRRFAGILADVLARPVRARTQSDENERRYTGVADAANRPVAIRARVQMIAEPGAVVLVASGGDPALADLGAQRGWHFPEARDGGWAGFEPVDGPAAVNHLEAQRLRGARYFLLPKPAFSWRFRFPELAERLEHTYRRVHQDEHFILYDVTRRDAAFLLDPPATTRVRVLGTFSAARTGPPPELVAELERSSRFEVTQTWRSDADAPPVAAPVPADADFVVFVRDDAILPSRFLDELIATQTTLGVDRIQPAHSSGPASGPPVTERIRGSIAREVDAATPLPVLSVRAGASLDGPVCLADNITVGLRRPIVDRRPEGSAFVRRVWVPDAARQPSCYRRPEPIGEPRISVLVATYNRFDLLRECLSAFAKQTLDRTEYEVVVIDDGSDEFELDAVLEEFADRIQVAGVRIDHAGRSAAKNLGVLLARAPLVLFFDDDDRAAPDYLEAHLRAHDARPGEAVAILGHTDWDPDLELTSLMHYVTDVDRLMFAYERLRDGQLLDWRGFWEGRISCKRSLLMRHALHDQRINYSIDVEMGWRLAPQGLRVVYDTSALSVMARPLDTESFCNRTEAKGRAHAIIAALHPGTDIARSLQLEESVAYWHEHRDAEPGLRSHISALEARAGEDETTRSDLYTSYRKLFRILHGKGVAEARGDARLVDASHSLPAVTNDRSDRSEFAMPSTVHPFENTDPDLAYDGSPMPVAAPALSITIPVWSRTPELAAMARETIDRVWEVARVPTEIVVVDNGSPCEVDLAAKVYRYPENKGVATGWNTGIRLATAPVVVVLNSDCRVEPGWDEALYEAATDGRRIAFPYTDHCDALGFVQPDQGGTAGWCFMLTKAVYEEVGVFDEWFNPAFCEDTDYWHRAWRLGIELTPVPAARVVHARRTTASTDSHVEMLLQGHRYKYGWKHHVDPHRAPPYYNRVITEYHGSFEPPGA